MYTIKTFSLLAAGFLLGCGTTLSIVLLLYIFAVVYLKSSREDSTGRSDRQNNADAVNRKNDKQA